MYNTCVREWKFCMQVSSIDWIRGCGTVVQLLSRGIVFRLQGMVYTDTCEQGTKNNKRLFYIYIAPPPTPCTHAHMHIAFPAGTAKGRRFDSFFFVVQTTGGLVDGNQCP